MFCQCDNKKRRFKRLLDRSNIFLAPTYYEEVYLKAYASIPQAKQQIGRYFEFFNRQRQHQSLNDQTPDTTYYGQRSEPLAA